VPILPSQLLYVGCFWNLSAWPLLFPARTTPFTVTVVIPLSDTSHFTEPLPPSTWKHSQLLCSNIYR